MKILVNALIFLSLFTLLISCNEQGINPREQIKDPREMVWVVDTIAYPNSIQTMMWSIWASSLNDVWISGHEATGGSGAIWHYDGLKWKVVEPMKDIPLWSIQVNKIMGLTPNNIWAVGARNYQDLIDPSKKWYKDMIINYDGTKWREYTQNSGCRVIGLYCNTPNDIWACGDSGRVFNYNGVNWKTVRVKLNLPTVAEYFLRSIAVMNNTAYLLASVIDIANRYKQRHYFIKGNMNNWTIADSMYYYNPSDKVLFGDKGLYIGPNKELYSYGLYGIWRYTGSSWEQSFRSADYIINGMIELKSDYKIAVGDFGNVLFYDGSIWNILKNLNDGSNNIHYQAVWTNGAEVFVIGYTGGALPQKTIVWHGK